MHVGEADIDVAVLQHESGAMELSAHIGRYIAMAVRAGDVKMKSLVLWRMSDELYEALAADLQLQRTREGRQAFRAASDECLAPCFEEADAWAMLDAAVVAKLEQELVKWTGFQGNKEEA